MKTRQISIITVALMVLASFSVGNMLVANSSAEYTGGPLSGAIFTTTVDGDVVNENTHYVAKPDVYLDGGPGPNAPSTAAALPPGDYYFQVTDPSGKDLLSTRHIQCREFRVNENGVIDFVYDGYNWVREKGDWIQIDCTPNTGIDIDHSELGAITVQLYPFDDTPNRGGVYKVWVTPVDAYTGDHDLMPDRPNDQVNGENYQPGDYHGFVPRYSKTDNFKVAEKRVPPPPPEMDIRKFHDRNLNSMLDEGEEIVEGWRIDVTDPLMVTNTYYTSVNIVTATPGTYAVEEETPANTLQTASYLDDQLVSAYPTADPVVNVEVAGDAEESHSVLFGNIGLGQVTACKYYDANTNGMVDAGEAGIEGWKMILTGTAVNGETFYIVQFTGPDGCTTFTDLLPGGYTVTEVLPDDPRWVSTSPMSVDVSIESTLDGSVMTGSSLEVAFTNYYVEEGVADFDTKGYWHNKNGLAEITQDDVDYVNSLIVYSSPSTYFDAGDEPFDGFFEDGTEVEAAFNDADGTMIWAAGTYQAEISHFLVDRNANGEGSDPREQLAQQLLAFIFNVRHRTGDCSDALLWDGSDWVAAMDIIQGAIDAWLSGDHDLQVSYAGMLDDFNNNDSVSFLCLSSASAIYPDPIYL